MFLPTWLIARLGSRIDDRVAAEVRTLTTSPYPLPLP